MSDENKFFRWVWRFNGIVIALVVYALLHLGITRLLRLIAHRQTSI